VATLGIISEVFEMAKYSKYEHEFGTVHQINNLLEIADKDTVPDKYRTPLIFAALFLHLGHIPFTYSTGRALLLASNIGDRSKDNKIKKYVKKRMEKVLDKGDFSKDKKENILQSMFLLRDADILYKYFSGDILVSNWRNIKTKFTDLKDEDLQIIIRDLIDTENEGYKLLNLADRADFVQRDALYFGTVRLDISPKHLYGQLTNTIYSISEAKLLDSNLDYLTERFYNNPDIVWFSKLYGKILASLIMSKTFNLRWIEEYNDDEFKRLIKFNLDKNNKRTRLPATWINRAKELFDKRLNFTNIFDLRGIAFQKEKDVFDIEYKLMGMSVSERGLLTYPFNRGILLDINYLEGYEYPVDPNYEVFTISVYQDDSKKSLTELLRFIKNLSHYLSVNQIGNIREGLANQLSWTGRVEYQVDPIINAIVETIIDIEGSNGYNKGDFIDQYLNELTGILRFGELWHNFENIIWKLQIYHSLQQHRDSLEEDKIYHVFVDGLLSLPTRLLQFKSTKKYIDDIYNKLLKQLSSEKSNDTRGDLFEALCLIDKIRTRRGLFQLILNRMVVIDPRRPRNKQEDKEYDIIELFINEDGKAECWIYECSIVDDYISKDREKITKLADHIHSIFSDLIIRTRYIIPSSKGTDDWSPREEDVGRNYN